MTADEYNAHCAAVGLTNQREQAEFLGVARRTAHGYANGSPIPEATSKLLRVMKRLKLTAAQVQRWTPKTA